MIVDTHITIGIKELSRRKREKLFSQLTFLAPDQSVIQCYREFKNKIEIPRGAWHFVEQLDYIDNRSRPKMPELEFKIKLDDLEKDERFAGQTQAVEAALENEQGLIVRAPGTGKSNIGVAFMARAKTRSLVLVHTKDLLDQWCEYLSKGVPSASVGVIQGRTCEVGHITVGMVQTLRRFLSDSKHGEKWWRQFGAVVVDEVHHGGANSYDEIVNALPAYYRIGFTASLTRADGLHPYIKHLIGPVIHKQKFSSPIDLSIQPVFTKFEYPYRGRYDWQPLLNALVTDKGRNKRIAKIVDAEISRGNSILVLSRRIEQLSSIEQLIKSDSSTLIGTLDKSKRRSILGEFKSGRNRCLFATQLADEALDIPRLNRIILAHPGKHEGRIIQQIGRTLREFPDKEDAIIYDIVDKRVKPLKRQWSKRKHTYHILKIPIKKRRMKIADS